MTDHILIRHYDSLKNREKPLDFFKGLVDYLDFVFSKKEYKEFFKQQLSRRDSLYKQLDSSIEQTEKDFEVARKKLLKIISVQKINTKDFQRYTTHSAAGNVNLLNEFNDFIEGRINADPMVYYRNYLFDISVNLLRLGYKKEVSKYLLTDEEYGKYFQSINNSKDVIRNEYGNFVFSDSLPKYYELKRQIDDERMLTSWGSFETLERFWRAYKEFVAGTTINTIMSSESAHRPAPPLAIDDFMELFDILDDIQILLKNSGQISHHSTANTWKNKVSRLSVENYIAPLQTVHNKLLLISTQQDSELSTLSRKLSLNGKQVEFDETYPAILINNEKYPLPFAQNEADLARVMFKRRIGESVDWSTVYCAMTGSDDLDMSIETEKNRKMVQDTVYRLNQRMKKAIPTDDKLFEWGNKSIRRNF